MAPIIYVIRHAQGYHNVTKDFDMDDPDLTQQGVDECGELRGFIESHGYGYTATNLVVSPSLRTIRTCQLAFADVIETGLKITLHPDFQETGGETCNIPQKRENIEIEHGDMVDTSLLDVDFTNRARGTRYAAEVSKVKKRVLDARIWLRNLARIHGENTRIFVVTHQSFIKWLTGDYDKFRNTEMRSYKFLDVEAADEALKLVPTSS